MAAISFVLREPDGSVVVIIDLPGLGDGGKRLKFVPCQNPACGNDDVELLAQDPADGMVNCLLCNHEFNPEDHQ